MKAIAIICARADSKRFPHKNRARIAGQSLVQRAIYAARQSAGVVVRIAVTTDDPVISQDAALANVQVIARPPEFATDAARLVDAARHAVEFARDNPWPEYEASWPGADKLAFPEAAVIIQNNCPVWDLGTIPAMVARLSRGDCSAVATAYPARYPPDWMQEIDENGYARPYTLTLNGPRPYRQQDLKPAYCPDGQAVVLRVADLINGFKHGFSPHEWFGPRWVPHVHPWLCGMDIDEPGDLPLAEAALKAAGLE